MSFYIPPKYVKILKSILYIVLGAFAAYLFVKYALSWFLPFLIAFAVARLLEPVVSFLVRKCRFPRKLASLVLVFLSYASIGTLLYFLVAWLARELSSFIKAFPSYLSTLAGIVETFLPRFYEFVDKLPGDIPSFVTEQANNILSDIKIPTSAITTVTKGITNFAFSLPSALIFIIVLLVSTYFISSDYDSTKKFIATQIPEKFREGISRTAQHLVNTLGKWLKAMGIIVLITFTELAIGLYLIGIDYAIIIAMIIAVIDVLPVLGVGTVLIPWSIIGFISGNVYIGVCILVLYIVITIVRNVLEPKIVGHQIGLHPLVTLISMYVGLRTIGFAGMFLFPIIAITLQKLQEWDYIKVYKTQSDTVSSEENESEDPPTEDSPTEDSPTE